MNPALDTGYRIRTFMLNFSHMKNFESSPAVEMPPSLGAQLVHDYLLKKDLASYDIKDENLSKDTHSALLRLVDRVRTIYSENNSRKNLKGLPETSTLIDLVRPNMQGVLKNLKDEMSQEEYEKTYNDLVVAITERIDALLAEPEQKKAA